MSGLEGSTSSSSFAWGDFDTSFSITCHQVMKIERLVKMKQIKGNAMINGILTRNRIVKQRKQQNVKLLKPTLACGSLILMLEFGSFDFSRTTTRRHNQVDANN